jgi:hypothetical protein
MYLSLKIHFERYKETYLTQKMLLRVRVAEAIGTGILFNPDDKQDQMKKADLFQHNETWHSWKHHSRFSGHHCCRMYSENKWINC